MRKIISKEEQEKRKKKTQIIIGGVLVLVMLFSLIGYSSNKSESGSTEEIKLNGFKFTKTDNLWNVNAGGYQFSFLYSPKELEKINSDLHLLDEYSDKPLYIYSEDRDAETEIYKNLFYQNKIAERVQEVCIEGKKCDGNLPVKTCKYNLIIIKESENKKVEQQENCLIIEGKKEELSKITDGVLFKIIGLDKSQ